MKVNKLAQIFMFFAIFICSLLAIIFLVTNHIMLFLIAFGLSTYISLNKKIKQVTFPRTLKKIETQAFKWNKLTRLEFKSPVEILFSLSF